MSLLSNITDLTASITMQMIVSDIFLIKKYWSSSQGDCQLDNKGGGI